MSVEIVGDVLAEPERATLTRYLAAWNVRSCECFSNFDLRGDTLCPPLGYVARAPAASPFSAGPFLNVNMFAGVSVFDVRVDWSMSIPPARLRELELAARVHIRDVSPVPVMPGDKPTGSWVEALGDGGSVGFAMSVGAAGEVGHSLVPRSLPPTHTCSFLALGMDRGGARLAPAGHPRRL